MLLLDIIMSRTLCVWEEGPEVAFYEARHRYDARNVMTIMWMESIYDSLPERYRPYVEWPLSFAKRMKATFRADTSFWRLASVEGDLSVDQLQLDESEDGFKYIL